jgi:hypothetical protein
MEKTFNCGFNIYYSQYGIHLLLRNISLDSKFSLYIVSYSRYRSAVHCFLFSSKKETMIVAIASKRGPKVEAVKNILPKIFNYLSTSPTTIECLTHEVEAGISMPRTLTELLTGAEERVVSLQEIFNIALTAAFAPFRNHSRANGCGIGSFTNSYKPLPSY